MARRLLLGDAPLGDFLRLPVDDIEGATLSEVRAWRDAVFAQANATVAAAGVAPAAEVAAAVDTLLERLPEFPAGEPAGAPQPAYGGRTVLIVAPDAESSAIGVFGPLPSTGASGGVLNVLALEALDRRLARGLRREFGDGYDISARPSNYARDVRLLAIGGEVAAADLEEVLEVTRQTYERFRARGPTPREAAKGADHAARMFEGVEDAPEAVAQIVAELVLDGELATIADDLPGRLREVEPRTLRAHVKDAFPAWDEMLRIVVAPYAEAAPADCVIDTLDALETAAEAPGAEASWQGRCAAPGGHCAQRRSARTRPRAGGRGHPLRRCDEPPGDRGGAERPRDADPAGRTVARLDGGGPARPARIAGGGMRQSRLMSIVEALANVVVGYGVAVLVQVLVFPLFGFTATLGQNLGIGLVFTTVSLVRSLALRRIFERLR